MNVVVYTWLLLQKLSPAIYFIIEHECVCVCVCVWTFVINGRTAVTKRFFNTRCCFCYDSSVSVWLYIKRPHRSTMYNVHRCGLLLPTKRPVCHTSESCKNGWTDWDAVRVEDSGRPKEPCVRWGSRLLYGIVIQQRMSRQKDWRNQAATGWILAFEWKMQYSCFPFCQVVQKHKLFEVA